MYLREFQLSYPSLTIYSFTWTAIELGTSSSCVPCYAVIIFNYYTVIIVIRCYDNVDEMYAILFPCENSIPLQMNKEQQKMITKNWKLKYNVAAAG